MTIRERLTRCIRHEPTDRVPVNYLVGRGPMSQRLLDHFGVKSHPDLIRKLGIDGMDPWGWALVEPEYRGPPRPPATNPVVMLVAWGAVSEYAIPMAGCDTVRDLGRHEYPRAAWLDVAGLADRLRVVHDQDNLALFGPVSVGFTHHVRMRGFEQAFLDLTDDAWMGCYLEQVMRSTEGIVDAVCEAASGALDIVHLDEDVGANDRMLISPEIWRRYYRPLWAATCDLVKRHGIRLWMHSCGYCRDIIEDFIDLGIDVLNPIPAYVAGNDQRWLKERFGRELCFDGGVDQPTVMIRGTPAQVEDEVRRVLDIMAPGGGFMIQPSQGLTVDMPMENIERFFEAALKHGSY
jgi:uroporphyrinogen decarboxylase